MNIVFQHNGVLPVLKYGGTERIIFWLMKELARQGHQVTLIGHPDSKVEEFGIRLVSTSEDWPKLIPKDTDLIHLFYNPDEKLDFPLLVTIEGNGQLGEEFHCNTVFVSRKHAEVHGSDQFVYNGLDLEEYPYRSPKHKGRWESFLFLAKAKWKVKNLKDCIRACRYNKKHLHIAGGRVFPRPYVHSHGMVDQKGKFPLFEKVDALLWPVRWHEPFGIAVIEAYSQGLPVVASPYGSLSELVNSEVGVLCPDYKKFEEVLSWEGHHFDPDEIRSYLERNFSSAVMTENYLALYKKVIAGENLNKMPPKYSLDHGPEVLLPF